MKLYSSVRSWNKPRDSNILQGIQAWPDGNPIKVDERILMTWPDGISHSLIRELWHFENRQGVNNMIGMNSTLEDRNMSGSSRVESSRASFLYLPEGLNALISFNLNGWRSLGTGADSRAWLWFSVHEVGRGFGAWFIENCSTQWITELLMGPSIERVMWDRVIVAEFSFHSFSHP